MLCIYWRNLSLPVFILFIGNVAHTTITQDQCGSVDLQSRFGTVREQTGESCFAFAGSDLVGEALGLRPPEQVSARHIDASRITSTPQEGIEIARANSPPEDLIEVGETGRDERYRPLGAQRGSATTRTLENYRFHGRLCLESQIPSQPPAGFCRDRQCFRTWYNRQDARYYGLPTTREAPRNIPGVQRLLPPNRHLEANQALRADCPVRARATGKG